MSAFVIVFVGFDLVNVGNVLFSTASQLMSVVVCDLLLESVFEHAERQWLLLDFVDLISEDYLLLFILFADFITISINSISSCVLLCRHLFLRKL